MPFIDDFAFTFATRRSVVEDVFLCVFLVVDSVFSARFAGHLGRLPVSQFYKVREEVIYYLTYKSWLSVAIIIIKYSEVFFSVHVCADLL